MTERSFRTLSHAGDVSLDLLDPGCEALSEFLIGGIRTGHRVRGKALAGAWHVGGASLVAANDSDRLYFTLLGAETGLVEEVSLKAVNGPVQFAALKQEDLSVLFRFDGKDRWRIKVCAGVRPCFPYRKDPQVERPFAISSRLCISREPAKPH